MPARAAKTVHLPSPLPGIEFKALGVSANYHHMEPVSDDVTDRVRCEFVEMRGFSPTVEQAARLFQINPEECGRILKDLVKEGFLRQTPDGRYRLPPQQ